MKVLILKIVQSENKTFMHIFILRRENAAIYIGEKKTPSRSIEVIPITLEGRCSATPALLSSDKNALKIINVST